MGRKQLYDENTFPLLAEQYAREGNIDTTIAKLLGISETVYYVYQNEYPEFREAIKKGKKPVDVEVENALLKNALGYDYDEKHSTMKVDPDGVATVTEVKTVTKHIKGDTGAQAFWLKNRQAEKWRDHQSIGLSGGDSFLAMMKEASSGIDPDVEDLSQKVKGEDDK